MIILKTSKSLRRWRKALSPQTSIGFVPTMGALHAGHEALIERSLKKNDLTLVSIFVNPTQFDDPKDLEKYPDQKKEDLACLKRLKVDALFMPRSATELYPPGGDVEVVPHPKWALPLEGEYRSGHFRGVATVVLKLFNLVQPHRAYFGEKDFQQLQIIRQMVRDLFIDLQVVAVKTKRERDGLALSSRNARLSEPQRKMASELYHAICEESSPRKARTRLEKQGFRVDYLVDWQGRRFVAAHLGSTRLIDNIKRDR